MKKAIIVIAIMVLCLNVYAQTDINNYTVDSIATLSCNSPYSLSEDLVIKIGNDSLFDIFRLDSTRQHVGNAGEIAKRFSYDGGNTWTQPVVVFNSPVDDRCIGGGLINGKIMIFFLEYDLTTNISIPYSMYSSDNGITFNVPTFLNIPFIDSSATPYGPIIKVDSGKYYQAFYGGGLGSFWGQLIQCLDTVNMVWGNPITVFDTTDDCAFSELGVIYFSKDSLIVHVRHDNGDYTYSQFVSSNNGNTWSNAGVTNIGTRVMGAFRPVSPWFAYDAIRKEIIGLPTIRNGSSLEFYDNILCYINNGADVYSNPMGWTIRDSVTRPMPTNNTDLYGYVTTTWLNDSTLFCIMTDDSATIPLTTWGQYEALYQFKITYHTPPVQTSVKEINSLKDDINISPNPANESFAIWNKKENEQNIQVKIIDVNGRVYNTTNMILTQNPTNISTSHTPPGNYFIEIMDQDTKIVKPLAILH